MKVDVDVLSCPYGFCGRKETCQEKEAGKSSEVRSCVKGQLAILSCSYGLCGRRATLEQDGAGRNSKLRGCLIV